MHSAASRIEECARFAKTAVILLFAVALPVRKKNGPLNKRGWKLGGYSFTKWNSDTFGYDSSTIGLRSCTLGWCDVSTKRLHGHTVDRQLWPLMHEDQRVSDMNSHQRQTGLPYTEGRGESSPCTNLR